MSKRDWIQTASGRRFYPFDPRPDDIDIDDIAHALSLKCRFGGQCRTFYSVAEHSVRVAGVLEEMGADIITERWGLLHDAAEAYLADIPTPIKVQPELAPYREAEDAVQRAICRRFGLPEEMPPAVKEADKILLATEARDLMRGMIWSPLQGVPTLPGPIEPWAHQDSKKQFISSFRLLFE